ncbi:MazG nucleotide pyrophosphohydrolase domain-containing protein [Deinococcus sp.]|uniref:MazG nucleotide pyrophosphohydrolase domain-containing protein n=1 Tax=Deinococcus sp. TaxID=47478 RepID=UPI003B5B37FF
MESLNLENLGADLQHEFAGHLAADVDMRLHMLVSEVGELAKEVVKARAYGTRPFAVTDGFKEELGDVLCDLALLAEAANVSLSECAELTVTKIRRRLAERGHVGSETA